MTTRKNKVPLRTQQNRLILVKLWVNQTHKNGLFLLFAKKCTVYKNKKCYTMKSTKTTNNRNYIE